jgi:hypothetical protein
MTIKEAILQSLEDISGLATYNDITQHIIQRNYIDFKDAKTPSSTVSALLGDFIRYGDSRVKRIKQSGGYFYYLAKNESSISIDKLTGDELAPPKSSPNTYNERSLHKLLSSYLKSTGIYAKTIYHEQSNGKDSNQIWTHPDMVGIKFLKLQSTASQSLLKSINQVDAFKLSSYEIKREISSDSDLKKAYFQAVSNSSWANYGYLVAFEFSDSLMDEMSRLNQSFGIGIIELDANPYQSKLLFPAKFKELDFKTIDKLCVINPEFDKFIEHVEKLLTAQTRYYGPSEREFTDFCDAFFKDESEIEHYLKEERIPNLKE